MGQNQRIVVIGSVLLGVGLFLGSVISSRHVTVPISQPQETGFQKALRESNSPQAQAQRRLDDIEHDLDMIRFRQQFGH